MNKKSKIIVLLVLCAAAVAVWSLSGSGGPKLDDKKLQEISLSPEEKKQAEAEAAAQAAAQSAEPPPAGRKVPGKK